MVFALNGTVTLTFDLVTWKFIGVIYWPWPIFLPSTMTVTHKLIKILSGHGFCIKWYFDLGLWPSDLKIHGVIYWPWPIFLPSTMSVTHKLFKILNGHGFCIKWYCVLDLWPSDLKFLGVIYWPWPIFLPSTMTVTHKLFKILSGHDVANGRTNRQTDRRTNAIP